MAVDLDKCISNLFAGKLLSVLEIHDLCLQLQDQLINTPNICKIQTPVIIVGDIHGQFFDLLEIFKVCGCCPDVNYLFLGDYVDRGYYSVQTISLLLCLRLRYPNRITLLRGNHETRQVTQIYGFYSECVRTYGSPRVWEDFVNLFDCFNIAAMVGNSMFCVHGGLSPAIKNIDDIVDINRKQEIPHEGGFSDLMWSDPDSDPENRYYRVSQRGCGHLFGDLAVKEFLKENNISHIVRAHQLCMDGYQKYFNETLTTVWSAPNYCYRCGNLASVMEIDEYGESTFNHFLPCPQSERKALNLETNQQVPDYFL